MEKKIKRNEPAALFLLLYLLLMVRNCACGPTYYPQLDDYIQYHNYASAASFQALQQSTGLLDTRPLAGLADYFVWSPMFDHMILGLALISLLYVLTVMLFWKILQRYFHVSILFPVLVTLLPLGMEGTYWMSAATRVVVGMFFGVLATRIFLKWLDSGGWGWLIPLSAGPTDPFWLLRAAGHPFGDADSRRGHPGVRAEQAGCEAVRGFPVERACHGVIFPVYPLDGC